MTPIKITTQRGNFLLNDTPIPSLLMRSSFSTAAQLYRGEYNAVDEWFARCKELGFHGVRVFGETYGWAGSDFFGDERATGPELWDYDALRRGERPRMLEPKNQGLLLDLITLLQKHGLVCEYVVDATLKGGLEAQGGASADMIGHCIRQTAAWLYAHENAFGPTNIFLETHNEWDAHIPHNGTGNTLAEINRQFMRMRRWKHEDGRTTLARETPGEGWEAEQWPTAVVGVSHGGRNTIDYAIGYPQGADYAALHPERSGEWWTRTRELEAFMGVAPVYYNESKCYLSQEQWDRYVVEGQFGATACTTDTERYLEFMRETRATGRHFCVHDANGMISRADSPVTELERELSANAPPDPPPTPAPTLGMGYNHIIHAAYVDILLRPADDEGLRAYSGAMADGMTEAEMRQDLIDSPEFTEKFL